MSPKHSKKSATQIKETPNRQFGTLLSRIRKNADLSRPALVEKLLRETDLECLPDNLVIGEQLIKTLDEGTRVNIPCGLIEALCQVLKCSSDERRDLFLYAGHSPLISDKTPDPMAKVLYSIVVLAYEEVQGVLNTAVSSPRAGELKEQELRELAIEALDIVLRQLKRSQARVSESTKNR